MKPLFTRLKIGQIRLIKILGGSETPDDPIKCRLYRVDLDKIHSTQYDALSCAWGDPNNPKMAIAVNGHQLGVTENCHLALRELRHEAISQLKTNKFGLMPFVSTRKIKSRRAIKQYRRRIYQTAQKLIVSLGPAADGSEEAIEILEEASQCSLQSASAFSEWKQRFKGHPRYQERQTCVACFFSRPWFTRIWIIQEFEGSSEVTEPVFFAEEADSKHVYCYTGDISHRIFPYRPRGSWKVIRKGIRGT